MTKIENKKLSTIVNTKQYILCYNIKFATLNMFEYKV